MESIAGGEEQSEVATYVSCPIVSIKHLKNHQKIKNF